MCRGCGAIVGAGQGKCAVCGLSTAVQAPQREPRRVPDRETMRFARAVLNRPYKFTIILLVANFFVFLLMWQSSGMSFNVLSLFPYPVLIAFGAKLNLLIEVNHQWWRFVTPMFIHVNLLHLLVNMYSLWIVGPYVEKLYGSAKFVVFWVLTGIAGVVASYLTVVNPGTPMGALRRFLFKIHDEPSAGASGALFGLVGVLFVFGIKFRHELPEGFKRAFGTGLLPMIMLNLFIGYIGRGVIDNAAHLGGLVSGAALALVVDYRRPGERKQVELAWRLLQLAAIGLVVVSFIMVAKHLNDPIPLPVRPLARSRQNEITDFVRYSKGINDAQDALGFVIHDKDSSRVDSAIEQLEVLPSVDQHSDSLRARLRGLLVEAKDVNASLKSAPEPLPKELQQRRNALVREFEQWKTEYNNWLRTDGRKYVPIE